MSRWIYLGVMFSGLVLLGAGCAREPEQYSTPAGSPTISERSPAVTAPIDASEEEFPPAYTRPIPDNYFYAGTSIHYGGEAVISGKYYVSGFFGEICFDVDQASQQLIPKNRKGFCFNNQEEVAKKLYDVEFKDLTDIEIPKPATIKISSYTYNTSEGASVDMATLVEVLSK